MPLHVAFLWHMHQPDYVDSVEGVAVMPWVRLHATKGYLDMIAMVDRFPDFRCTFNLTPVLLKQIEELSRGEVRDRWQELAATPAEDLDQAQKTEVLEHFFKANYENMIKPYPRYWSLLQKRGLQVSRGDLPRLANSFSTTELRDLQVWFNLAWFGYAAENLYPEIGTLKRKGELFTEEDKRVLFEQQTDILKNLLAFYRAVAQRGQIEISTTPFYHPIMPLLYNTEFARRCQPGVRLPAPFSHPEDVRAQLQMACDLHTRLFGVAPRGIWPSEGSVCPELIPILQELGLEWFATDEDILWRSLSAVDSEASRERLFRGYRACHGGAGASVAFRDRSLSDFIGFNAARNEPARAAGFIVDELERIVREEAPENGVCAVVLDGENAWENFADGGEGFLSELYRRLSAHPELKPTTFGDYFREHPPVSDLHTLHTGSWIQSNFKIWIGHPEDNHGWEVLGKTRRFLQAKWDRREIGAVQYRKAMNEIYAAEGSDWFWWYGDDFTTENDILFDQLFRAHLKNVYRIAGAQVPQFLEVQICRSELIQDRTAPAALIHPIIDGRVTSYYEWAGAGVYEAGKAMSSMYQAERLLDTIYFGADLENFYLRIDLRGKQALPSGTSLCLNFGEEPQRRELILSATGTETETVSIPAKVSSGEIIEMSVRLDDLGWEPGQTASFFVEVVVNGMEIERHPSAGSLVFTVPDERFAVENWAV